MKIGCAVGVLRTGPAAGNLPGLRLLGIDYIEPQFGTDAADVEDAAFMKNTRDILTNTGLQVWSCHAPFGPEVDISSAKVTRRERGIAAILRTARGCAELGGKVIVVHCGDEYREDNRQARREAVERSVASLREIVDRCFGMGVRVALENLPPGHLTSSADELMPIVEDFPPEKVGVCVDTGHAHISGDAPGLVRRVAGRIITTHLHDNDRSNDQHRVPGLGTIDWEAVGAALARSPYFASPDGGPLMFEASGPGTHAEAISKLPGAGRMIARFMVR